jgi:hypothetical protein
MGDVITYDFTDEKGILLYQEVRGPGKTFYLRRPDGNGGFVMNLDGARRVPYRLSRIREWGGPIVWVEGPKDADTVAEKLGLVATTCAGGVNGWRSDLAQYFRDKYLIVLRDNDAPGLELRERVVRDSLPFAKRVVFFELPGVRDKGDITDWLEDGHSPEEFMRLVDAAEAAQQNTPHSSPVSEPIQRHRESPLALATFPEIAWVGPFNDYRRLVCNTTEAPNALHWGALYITLGMLIGRQRYVETPHPVYANDYAIVIGETGLGRKSTAIEYIHECLERLGAPIEVLSGLNSAEGLYEQLARASDTRALIFEDELRTLMAAATRKGTRNMLPCLCRLYRAPKYDQLTMRHGGLKAERPFVSLLGATTTTWIRSGLEEEAVSGGFFNRCLVIAGERKSWVAHPTPPAQDRFETFISRWLRPLVEKLRDGPQSSVHEDLAAWQRWESWYPKWQEYRLKHYNETLQQLTARTDIHARKIALTYAIVQRHDEITQQDLDIGIAVAEHCESLTVQLLGDVNQSRLTRVENRILALLSKNGQAVARRWLQQQIGGNYSRDDFLRALGTLIELGEIEELPAPSGRGPAGSRIRRVEG